MSLLRNKQARVKPGGQPNKSNEGQAWKNSLFGRKQCKNWWKGAIAGQERVARSKTTGKLVYGRTTNRASRGIHYELVETVTLSLLLMVEILKSLTGESGLSVYIYKNYLTKIACVYFRYSLSSLYGMYIYKSMDRILISREYVVIFLWHLVTISNYYYDSKFSMLSVRSKIYWSIFIMYAMHSLFLFSLLCCSLLLKSFPFIFSLINPQSIPYRVKTGFYTLLLIY